MSDLKDLGRNADQIIWRAWDGDYYADSIHVTHEGAIGISCGGTVHVMPVKDWHKLATLRAALTPPADDKIEAIRGRHEELEQLGHLAYHDWASEAHADRATLLRALDAERQRRVEVERAACNIVEGVQLSEYESLPDDRGFSTRLTNWNHEDDFTLGDLRRLATLTKETP